MTERLLLEVGMRAVGIVFLFEAFSESFVTVLSSLIFFQEFTVAIFVLPMKGAVAFLLVRRAHWFAVLLSDSVDTSESRPPNHAQWNRWIIGTAAVFGFAQAMTNSTHTLTNLAEFGLTWNDFGVASVALTLLLMAAAEVAILWWLFGATIGYRAWLMGTQSHVE